jgi:hypothetical protein
MKTIWFKLVLTSRIIVRSRIKPEAMTGIAGCLFQRVILKAREFPTRRVQPSLNKM